MKMYTVDDFQSDGCQRCCCDEVSVKPGTSVKVTVNYAPWAVPIGRLHCLPSFDLEQKDTCPAASSAPIPTSEPLKFSTPSGESNELDVDLDTAFSDPGGGEMSYRVVPLYGPWHGTVVIDSADLTYTPNGNFEGADRFFVTATSSSGQSTTVEMIVAVNVDPDTIKGTPHVWVDAATISTNEQYYTASFAVRASPAAQMCEVWRLTVMQNAIDCDCQCYNRTDCFDIRMVKC